MASRFPARVAQEPLPVARHGRRALQHVIPDDALDDPDRYRGTLEDETRPLYVAVTRAQKYLYATFAPVPDNQQQKNPLRLLRAHRRAAVGVDDPQRRWQASASPQPLQETPRVTLSFSELKYLFECSYQFKLRFLYGFNAPIHEALGYGKGLHDALAEVHKRALEGDFVTKSRRPRSSTGTSTRRSPTPRSATSCGTPESRPSSATSTRTAGDSQHGVLREANPGPRRARHHRRRPHRPHPPRDSGEVAIVDFKSSERAQAEDVTRDQLHVYAVGYQDSPASPPTSSRSSTSTKRPDEARTRKRPTAHRRRERSARRVTGSGGNDLPRLAHPWRSTRAGRATSSAYVARGQ